MKIIFLYTRHWTTAVGPLKWFGQNCTTELPNIQQECTRVLQIKIVLLCKYFLQGSWWKCWKIFLDQFRFIRSEMFNHKLQAAPANAAVSQTKQLPSTREMYLFTPASPRIFVKVQFLSWRVISFVAMATIYGSSQSFLPLGGVIRELKHARFRDADCNRKRTFLLPGPYCLPDFYITHLWWRKDT